MLRNSIPSLGATMNAVLDGFKRLSGDHCKGPRM